MPRPRSHAPQAVVTMAFPGQGFRCYPREVGVFPFLLPPFAGQLFADFPAPLAVSNLPRGLQRAA